jgi:cytochrome c-type biogenesis protein CcmE
MNKKKLKFVVGGLVILAAIASLGAFALSKNAVYYYTVSEMKASGPRENVRVSGQLLAGSVQGGEVGAPLRFKIYDKLADGQVLQVANAQDSQVLEVSFVGTVPDSFKDDPKTEVVVEGDYSPNGLFNADTMLAKCPSKYQAASARASSRVCPGSGSAGRRSVDTTSVKHLIPSCSNTEETTI